MSGAAQRFLVSGRVQGVWFRAATRQKAEALGLSGHACNLPDGSVEVVAAGSTDALEELHQWLHEGPPLARVDEVARADFEGSIPPGFRTL